MPCMRMSTEMRWVMSGRRTSCSSSAVGVAGSGRPRKVAQKASDPAAPQRHGRGHQVGPSANRSS